MINSANFSGVIADIKGTKDIRAILVKSMVSGKMPTVYTVLMKADIFYELDLCIGLDVVILNATYWQENEKNRFRVDAKNQIWTVLPETKDYSYMSFVGEVSFVEEESKAFLIHIKHKDKEKEIDYPLVVSKKIYQDISLDFGDKVLVNQAQMYMKDGKFRFRIPKKEQISIIKKNSFDKGEIMARDKFI